MSQYRLPADFSQLNDPVAENPFPEGNPRRAVWANATGEAHEEVARIQAAYLQRAATACTALEVLYLEVEGYAALFDAWAKRAIKVVWSDEDLATFDSWLVKYANGRIDLLARVHESAPSSFPAGDILTRLRNSLGGRAKHWMAEARRYLAERKRDQPESTATPREKVAVSSWAEVAVEFCSEELVQVRVLGKLLPADNYAALGLEDRRARKPSKAWGALLRLATARGEVKPEFAERKYFEKRVQELRPLLRQYLERRGYIAPADDPLPCRRGRYTAAFSISTRPSFGPE